MTSSLDPTGAMALRLAPALRDEFTARYGARVAEQHGRVMRHSRWLGVWTSRVAGRSIKRKATPVSE